MELSFLPLYVCQRYSQQTQRLCCRSGACTCLAAACRSRDRAGSRLQAPQPAELYAGEAACNLELDTVDRKGVGGERGSRCIL